MSYLTIIVIVAGSVLIGWAVGAMLRRRRP
jgi:hypothetical protein